MGAQKFTGAQKLLRGHDASASLRHPQMAPGPHTCTVRQKHDRMKLCCRRRTARRAVSVRILPTAAQLSERAAQRIHNKSN